MLIKFLKQLIKFKRNKSEEEIYEKLLINLTFIGFDENDNFEVKYDRVKNSMSVTGTKTKFGNIISRMTDGTLLENSPIILYPDLVKLTYEFEVNQNYEYQSHVFGKDVLHIVLIPKNQKSVEV